jgi:prevent-host-death family protein
MAVTVGIRELRNNLRKYLSLVKDGEVVNVTERGKVIARIGPASEERRTLEDLAAAGLVTLSKRPRKLLGPEDLIPARGSVSDIVIEQRR